MSSAEKAILHTLAYSSVFAFPLTKEELWQFLISNEKIDKNTFEKALKNLPKAIVSKNGFYTLTETSEGIEKRRRNASEVEKKLQIAKRAAYYLSYIPTILLVGISGSVAMGKAEQSDDIDFFIVTKKNNLFITRIWIQAILEMLHLRRKRQQDDAHDKICVNLLIDESQLSWPSAKRDLYTAHEILQLKPLFERNNTYEQFLKHNEWVQQHFPNAFEEQAEITGKLWRRRYLSLSLISALLNIRPFEKMAAFLQKRYMKRFQTREVVNEHVLAFHPIDYRSKILMSLDTKLQQLGLLTNK